MNFRNNGLRNNAKNNKAKDIIKAFKFLEDRGILLKKTIETFNSKRRITKFSCSINKSCVTIVENYAYTIS